MNDRLDKLLQGTAGKASFGMDLFLLTVALAAATDWAAPFATTTFLGLLTAALGFWGVIVAILRLYSPYTPRKLIDAIALAILGSTVTAILLFGLDRVLLGAPPDHFNALLFLLLLLPSTIATQTLLNSRLSQGPQDDVLIIGTSALGLQTARSLEGRRNVVGFLSFEDEPESVRGVEAPVFGAAKDLVAVLEQHPVDEVYLAGRVVNFGLEMQSIVKTLEELGMPFAVPLHSLRFNRAQLLSSSSVRDGYLHYLNTPTQPSQLAIKRLVDIVGASVGLVVLSPLLLTVAAIIKITAPGPVFFKQTRVGLHGAHFNFLKFRSMVVNADAMKDQLMAQNERKDGPAFKMKNDPRVTPIGRFIRKFSIDELPQLINVLRGDMTIVGPRPPVPREVALYKPWQRRRLSVRPGLTCYWQVGGRDQIGFEEWMYLDLQYVDHWSIGKDIALILKTIPVVVLGRGAS
jgi:exopolysaccharide biosynthesis polyprenyl glycosylphosphotransferase